VAKQAVSLCALVLVQNVLAWKILPKAQTSLFIYFPLPTIAAVEIGSLIGDLAVLISPNDYQARLSYDSGEHLGGLTVASSRQLHTSAECLYRTAELLEHAEWHARLTVGRRVERTWAD
jgi:hypothetical protein